MAMDREGIEDRMRHDVRSSRAPLSQASHLPSYFYTAPEIFRLERDRIFMKDWLCVARADEIETPGDYVTVDIFDEPIAVARDRDGTIAAFSNTCLHRGVKVAQGRGNAERFSCPYHAWTYDLGGRLLGAPHMKEAVDFPPAGCRLPPLPVGLWGGWVFVTLDPQPVPFADYIRRFADEFAFLQLDDCRLADRITFELDCNWKFVVENLFDVYHVMVIHRGSFGKFREAVDYFKDGRGEESLYGYYNSAALVPDGKSLFGNMPWLADKPATFACLGHLPPNLQLFGRCDAVVMDAIWPIAPDRTRLELHILFPKIHFAQPDFADKLKVYHDFQVRVIEEDRELVTSLQAGARSSKFRPGRLSQLEHGVYNEINHYLDRMLAEA